MTRRLLYLVNDAGYFASHRLPLALAARDAGWEVHVATRPDAALERLGAAGLAIHALPISRSGLRPDRELRSLLAARRLIRSLRPELVHCIALKAVLLGGLAARLAARPIDTPPVVLAIAGLGHVFTETTPSARLLQAAFRALLPLAAGARGRFILQNRADFERLEAMPALTGRCRLIAGSGVDPAVYRAEPEPEGLVTVLMASRLIRKKGVAEFVEAARRLRAAGVEVRFRLAGDSDPGNPATVTRAELEAWHAEGAVEWLGRRDDVPALLAASHIACLPSYYGEGVPKSLIEAAAAGRPAVTTATPGCADIVRDGENGLTVSPRDVEALAEALRRLIEDGALRRRLGARGREIAIAEFGLEQVIAETLALYRELV